MFYTFGIFDLDQFPLKKFLHMDTYKFDNENQAMYCVVDIKVIIKSLKSRNQLSNFHKYWNDEIHWKED
jgi:hypothetical protein